MSSKIQWVALVAVLIIAIGAYMFPTQTKEVMTNVGSSASDIQNTLYSGIVTTQMFIGGTTAASSIGTVVSTGSCNTGAYAASTTEFAIANPFNATSTVILQVIAGTGQATTTTFQVGTSTASTGIVSTTISPTMANFSAATTSPFWVSGGITVGSAGYLSAGANTFHTIVLSPNEFVVGFATTTATGGGASAFTPGVACTYKLEWKN